LNDIDRCLKDTNGSISLSFSAHHNSLGEIRVELFWNCHYLQRPTKHCGKFN
jgi:hypothetical protein